MRSQTMSALDTLTEIKPRLQQFYSFVLMIIHFDQIRRSCGYDFTWCIQAIKVDTPPRVIQNIHHINWLLLRHGTSVFSVSFIEDFCRTLQIMTGQSQKLWSNENFQSVKAQSCARKTAYPFHKIHINNSNQIGMNIWSSNLGTSTD